MYVLQKAKTPVHVVVNTQEFSCGNSLVSTLTPHLLRFGGRSIFRALVTMGETFVFKPSKTRNTTLFHTNHNHVTNLYAEDVERKIRFLMKLL